MLKKWSLVVLAVIAAAIFLFSFIYYGLYVADYDGSKWYASLSPAERVRVDAIQKDLLRPDLPMGTYVESNEFQRKYIFLWHEEGGMSGRSLMVGCKGMEHIFPKLYNYLSPIVRVIHPNDPGYADAMKSFDCG